MERLTYCFFVIWSILMMYSCKSVSTPSHGNAIPYQVFPVNSKLVVSLTEDEANSDNYILVLREKSGTKCATVMADPCAPIIETVYQDSIYIYYYAFARYGFSDTTQRPFFRQKTEKVGDYNLVLRELYCLETEGLFAHWEPKVKKYGWCIDSIFFKNDSIICFYGADFIKEIPINRFFYKHTKNSFCTFEIDTSYSNILWFYFFPTEKVIQQYCDFLSRLGKKSCADKNNEK